MAENIRYIVTVEEKAIDEYNPNILRPYRGSHRQLLISSDFDSLNTKVLKLRQKTDRNLLVLEQELIDDYWHTW